MARAGITLFTWGYEGWGNWTDELVEAVDTVERSRGWERPLFVDIRASRKVRAEGFREHAFELRFGPDRYRWMNRLGNKAILTHEEHGSLIDPTAAADLLDLAVEMQPQRRRVIYFCSCPSPTDGCHRHWVARHLFEVAEERRQPVTVVEWPGFDSEPKVAPAVSTTEKVVGNINSGRASLPLGPDLPANELLALPWFTLVNLVDENTRKKLDFMLTGPAQHRAGGWQLPVMGGEETTKATLKLQEKERAATLVMPRTSPSLGPAGLGGDSRRRE